MIKPPETLTELFSLAVTQYGDDTFLRFKRGGRWISLTFAEVAERVRDLALGLYSIGVRENEKVAIWSENRPEWNIADLAVLALGAVNVPIYTTQSRQQVEYILKNSEATVLFVSSEFLIDALSIKGQIPGLQFIISFDAIPKNQKSPPVYAAEGVISKGRTHKAEEPSLYDRLCHQVRGDDLATLIYTSGTTGDPKGVMLTHENLTVNILQVHKWLQLDHHRDECLTYLPFSHIFERAVWYLYAYNGNLVSYAESIDTVGENLLEVRPTAMTSVPRMFEKIYARILEKGLSASFPRRQIFIWALGIGKRWAEIINQNGSVGLWLRLQKKIADALVFSKWRAALGGRIRLLISGGAPLAPEIGYAFTGAGITILQGYGLTETSPSITCNTVTNNRIGSVGKVIDGVQIQIDSDGEILVKGRIVMKGYFKRPDLTEEVMTEDGWFRTGDIGHLDKDGFLFITDRKKDLFKTSGGKYIAPQALESRVKSSRFISQVVVVGNNRKFASALVVPNFELLKNYAQRKGIVYSSIEGLIEHPQIVDFIKRQIDKSMHGTAKYEQIKKIALLPTELTIDAGELTPTLKPRRSVIEKKYVKEIDRLYVEEGDHVVLV